MRIDLALLTHLDACAEHRAAFAEAFPDGLTITGEPEADAVARVVAAGLDVGWFCGMVLTAPALAAHREEMAPVRDVYCKAVAPAAVAYDKAVATAYAIYREAPASVYAFYRKAVATADAAYREAAAPAYAAYNKTTAIAAWRLLSNPDNIRPEYR